MNEQDLEKRLRDVVDPQISAPASLHRFLRELPEAQTVRHRGPLTRMLEGLERIPGLIAPPPIAKRARLALGVAMAVVVGAAAGATMLSLRQGVPPAPNGVSGSGAPWQTPLRSMATHQPPVHANLGEKLTNVVCVGLPAVMIENMALPTAAIVTGAGKYVGVTSGSYGVTGLVHSDDGLYWDWSPPATLGQGVTSLTSIATDHLDTIVVAGGVQGVDGTADGRIWISADDGATWQETDNESVFKGVTVQRIVYGSGHYIALGWNSTSAADAVRQVAEWRSDDGRTWTHVATPIKGTSALVAPTAAGFVMSGAALAAGAIDEPPMWWSADGQTWTRAKATDNSAQLMGPLTSATVTGPSFVYAISALADGSSYQLVASYDGGMHWQTVKPDKAASQVFATYAPYASSVGALSTGMGMGYLFVTVKMGEGTHVWMSPDGGVSWAEANDSTVGGPTGNTLLVIGNGYQTGATKILSYGLPGSGLGIWLFSMAGY